MISKQTFLLASLLLAPTIAQADPSACRTIDDDTIRLQCYDDAFSMAEVSEEPESVGKWKMTIDSSELTDDRNVFLVLFSEDLVRGRFGESGYARLLIWCRENTTAVIFGFNDQFMASAQGYGTVEYRVDKQQMRTVRMQESTDNTVLGLWSGGQSIPFIKELLGHETLIVRATPFNESSVTVKFDISGLDNAITELRETCSW
ncbi:type VI secretion system-associated protein TagO [Oceanibium sediminis]|uniref:type VI secretion system-associated protein TagO n=1 Tax=Oceanibium sediminis TaxID=2026339 RepID=UPI001300B5E7|nr:type VI secretion system-associated protein TagO [Oceanibium sediminis]